MNARCAVTEDTNRYLSTQIELTAVQARERVVEARAKVLQVETGNADDGRVVVAEALSEGMSPVSLFHLTNLLHRAAYMNEDADFIEIGRIISGIVNRYADGVAERRGMV